MPVIIGFSSLNEMHERGDAAEILVVSVPNARHER